MGSGTTGSVDNFAGVNPTVRNADDDHNNNNHLHFNKDDFFDALKQVKGTELAAVISSIIPPNELLATLLAREKTIKDLSEPSNISNSCFIQTTTTLATLSSLDANSILQYRNKTENWENLHKTVSNRRQTITPDVAKKIDRLWAASMKKTGSVTTWSDALEYSTRDFCTWLERQFCGGKNENNEPIAPSFGQTLSYIREKKVQFNVTDINDFLDFITEVESKLDELQRSTGEELSLEENKQFIKAVQEQQNINLKGTTNPSQTFNKIMVAELFRNNTPAEKPQNFWNSCR